MAGDPTAEAALILLALLASATQPLVTIRTDAGVMTARLELNAAPTTVCNFARYMNGGHFDGGEFFRTVRSDHIVLNPVPIDVVQMQAREGPEFDGFGPIPMERTSITGLRHKAGALSMARDAPDSATSSWSIVVKDSPTMDFGGKRNRDGQGFAVFGYVTRGMGVVRAIQRMPANGETLVRPVRIIRIAADARSAALLAIGCAKG